MLKRCDSVMLSMAITEYNDAGLPVGRAVLRQLEIFRARAHS